MKRFIRQTILFLLMMLLVLLGVESAYYYTDYYQKKVNGSEVYNAIHQSQTKHYRKKLLMGDSAAQQLFPSNEDNDSVAYLTCNQAVSMAGMYLLLTDYLKTNSDSLPEEVVLLCTPGLLYNDLDIYSYQYFLKPFPQREYGDRMSDMLLARIHEIKYWWSALLPFFRTSNYSPEYVLPQRDYVWISPLTKEYLLKIDSVLQTNHLAFKMVSLPLNETCQSYLPARLEESMNEEELPDRLMMPYVESITYMPSSAYVDDVHFTHEVLDTIHRQRILNSIFINFEQ